ncbi:MAG TPA: hypothetical protein VFX86_04065 [Candidatus Saccharimonadales bacterium]|nr:hypothetical protein [Candidatus Saccharimonadales bacterium]
MSEQLKPPALANTSSSAADSKLSPAQQEQVHSPDFISWFGDWQNDPDALDTSKIVNSQTGEPQVFYHGTNRQFDISISMGSQDPAMLSNHGMDHDYKGIYVTDTPELAAQFADPLGSKFITVMNNIAFRFGFKELASGTLIEQMEAANTLDEDAFPNVIKKWNEVLGSCQQRDGRVKIIEQGKEYDIDDYHQLLEEGTITFSSSFSFDGVHVSHLGEMLQLYGGRFPDSDEELLPYKSLYSAHQRYVEQQASLGNQILLPANASPRIIPVFIKSLHPLHVSASGDFRGVDSAFEKGFDILEDNSGEYDSIVAEGEGSNRSIGTNIAVLDSKQFREAKE